MSDRGKRSVLCGQGVPSRCKCSTTALWSFVDNFTPAIRASRAPSLREGRPSYSSTVRLCRMLVYNPFFTSNTLLPFPRTTASLARALTVAPRARRDPRSTRPSRPHAAFASLIRCDHIASVGGARPPLRSSPRAEASRLGFIDASCSLLAAPSLFPSFSLPPCGLTSWVSIPFTYHSHLATIANLDSSRHHRLLQLHISLTGA